MSEINDEILSSEVFTQIRQEVSNETLTRAFPGASLESSSTAPIDWNLALFLSSALDSEESVEAQQAMMEVCFGAIQSSSATEAQRTAAALLLERLGNWLSIDLASTRDKISQNYRRHIPLPLLFDSVNAQLKFTIKPTSGRTFRGSKFQKEFWDAAERNEWISVSAPTSAGKSFIVRQWLVDQTGRDSQAIVIYIVPTRALIEEVSQELLADPALSSAHVHTLPWDPTLVEEGDHLLVMTQERLQLTFDRLPRLSPTALFVDEAQKIGDGYRGMLLEAVLRECVRRNPRTRAVFASPMTENPEVLLDVAPPRTSRVALESGAPSVNQNLYWLNPIPRRSPRWSIDASIRGEVTRLAEVVLEREPSPKSQRLAALPVALSDPESLNIVYANTAAEAEKTAKQIFEHLGAPARIVDQRVTDLQELVRHSVHPSYLLAEVLARGVAFHYGNMPQAVRVGVETLYRAGLVRFLVCTSTLLEGVNLPCTNIWVMNPRRGRGNVMSPADFWNLAGRAGRWGSEFSGNIICIDTRNAVGWPDPPTRRSKGRISFATREKLREGARIAKFISADGVHPSGERKDENLEAIASYLIDAATRGELHEMVNEVPSSGRAALVETVTAATSRLDLPPSLLRAHPGINPQAIARLYADLSDKDPTELGLLSPMDEGAFGRLVRVLARCERNLKAGFGPSGNQARLAVLLLKWMQGTPIPKLVAERMQYERQARPDKFNPANCIRAVLEDVEQIARYRAPKFLSCYADVVELIAPWREGEPQRPDIGMMLELGVSRTTDVSLMSLGLSRSVTVLLSEFIADDSLSVDGVEDWLRHQDLGSLGIPAMSVREVDECLERRTRRGELAG